MGRICVTINTLPLTTRFTGSPRTHHPRPQAGPQRGTEVIRVHWALMSPRVGSGNSEQAGPVTRVGRPGLVLLPHQLCDLRQVSPAL